MLSALRRGQVVPRLLDATRGLRALRPRFRFRRCRRRPGGVRDSARRRDRRVRGADHRGGLPAAVLAARGAMAAVGSDRDVGAVAADQRPDDRAAISSQGRGRPPRASRRRVSVPRDKRRGGVIEATVFAVVGVAILVGLGIWQLDRKVWKENLIATVTARLARAPEDLPSRESWPRLKPEADEYARVTFPAEFIAGEEALVYTAGSAFRPDVQG